MCPSFSVFSLLILCSRTHVLLRRNVKRIRERRRGSGGDTRAHFARSAISTILVRRERERIFARARSVGSRSRESRLYSVESRPSVPGSPAVPAYYSRESSRTARSLVHSVPGAVGCGNPPALYLLLTLFLSLTPSLFRFVLLPYLSLSFFNSHTLSLPLSLSFSSFLSLTLSLSFFLSL